MGASPPSCGTACDLDEAAGFSSDQNRRFGRCRLTPFPDMQLNQNAMASRGYGMNKLLQSVPSTAATLYS